MKQKHFSLISRIKRLSLFKKIVVGGLAAVLLLGAVVGARFVKNKLTTQPVYRTVQESEFVPVASEEEKLQIVEPSSKAILPGTKWIPQTFNNCGPATTAMVLAYFGFSVGQDVTKGALRTNEDDKNVFSYEMQAYLKTYGIESKIFYNGDRETIKRLIANGFYVVAEDWLHPNEDIGHVTILRGFDDEQGVFIADDSFLGTNIVYKYEEFEETQWKAFNREYIPIYRPELEEKLKAIIGEDWDAKTMYQKAVTHAQEEIKRNDRDMYAYFNLGTSYFGLGEYQKAYEAFEKARVIGWPKRMLWYQIQPVQTLNELGKYDEAIALADTGLWANDSFAELHVEKAIAYKGLGNTQKAKEEVQKALQYSPHLQSAKNLTQNL